jgi:hypothetical protein
MTLRVRSCPPKPDAPEPGLPRPTHRGLRPCWASGRLGVGRQADDQPCLLERPVSDELPGSGFGWFYYQSQEVSGGRRAELEMRVTQWCT